jgi:small subunit ribosomal protein S19e
MVTVRDVDPQRLIHAAAAELKKKPALKAPTWALYVKSGSNAERPPEQSDFWYLRAAAILRRIYLSGPVGTQRLRTVFGSRKRRGHKPAHHRPAGGKIIRLMIQQLEAEGLVAKVEKPRKGRIITAKGQKLLDKLSAKVR